MVAELNTLISFNLRNLRLAKVATFVSDILAKDTSDEDADHFADVEAAAAAKGAKTVVPPFTAYDPEPEWVAADSTRRAWFWKRYRLRWPVEVGHALYTIIRDPKIDLKRERRGKTYLTDVHERAAKHRDEVFLPADAEYELRGFKWVQLHPDEAEKLFREHEKTNPNARVDLEPHAVEKEIDGTMVQAIEFNVNASSAFSSFVEGSEMGGSLSWRRPQGAKPLVAFSQDEMVRHTHEYTSHCWALKGKRPIDQKSRGMAIHVSGWAARPKRIAFGFRRGP